MSTQRTTSGPGSAERGQGDSPADGWRTFSYEVSEAIAPTWESRRAEIEDVCTPVREAMVRGLDPQPGDTVLELAAGIGDTGFDVARIVGEGGRVISSDFSPAMIDAGRRRGAELGLDNVEYRVIDAERIELDADSVDGVLCRYGYMLMSDAAAALAETRRVLRPGGRLALAVWGPPERNPFFATTGSILVERGDMPPPDPDGPGIFSMASPERTTALLDAAGFTATRVEEIPVRFTFPGLDEYLRFLADTAGPIAMTLQRLGPDGREEIRSRLEQVTAPFASGDGGYELPALTLLAVAS